MNGQPLLQSKLPAEMLSDSAASHEACTASASPAEAEAEETLRIVLLGRTGTGRSSSGNTILGRSAFLVDASPCSVTKQCQQQTGTVDGRKILVIDTPGFFNTHLSPMEVLAEVGRCVSLTTPGPHALLVTLQPGRFTPEERDALQWITAIFGPEATRFTTVLFTCGDQLQGKQIRDFLEMSDELSEFVSSCQGGFHVFNNNEQHKSTESSQQTKELLEKIDKMVLNNGGSYYSNKMFRDAEATIREAKQRILGDIGHMVESQQKEVEQGAALEKRKEEDEQRRKLQEEERKRAEKLFWCELVTALGKGAAEGVGIIGKDKGKAVKKAKVVEKAAALAVSPLSVSSAAKAVGGAVREGSKVLFKHRKTFLH